jgi:hypothetical protein
LIGKVLYMALDTQRSIVTLILTGWRYAVTAIGQMRSVVGSAFLLTLILEATYLVFRSDSFAIDFTISLALMVAQSLVLSALAIAAHRYILLDEVAERLALNLADQRFRRFFGTVIALEALWLSSLIWLIVAHFVFGAPLLWRGHFAGELEGRAWVSFVFFVPAVVTGLFVFGIALDIVILFPAIAVDAPGIGWRNAMADSTEHTSRIFTTLALALIAPAFPFEFAEWILAPEGIQSSTHPVIQIIVAILSATELVLMVCVFAAVTSRLYLNLGRRLNGLAPAP